MLMVKNVIKTALLIYSTVPYL